jgi:hypothetical protein
MLHSSMTAWAWEPSGICGEQVEHFHPLHDTLVQTSAQAGYHVAYYAVLIIWHGAQVEVA